MEEIELTAESREMLGSGESRRIRRDGFVPAVLYGVDTKPAHLKVPAANLHKVIAGGENILIKLKVGGKADTVMIKEVQHNPIEGEITHIDFYRVSMKQEVEVKVPVDITGDAKGVKEKGGVLEQILREIEVKCLPGDMPHSIVVDVSGLDIGDTISAEQLKIPNKVKLVTAADALVVGVISPTVLKEEKPEEEVAAAAEPELIKKEKKGEDEEEDAAKTKEEGSEKGKSK